MMFPHQPAASARARGFALADAALAEDIVRLRYVSINGQLRRMLLVVKMRGSGHSIDMHEYEITDKGVIIGEPLRGYRALTSGIPGPWNSESANPGERGA